MKTKTKNHQNIPYSTILTAIGAWLMAVATVIGVTDVNRRTEVVLNTVAPVYVAVDDSSPLYTRNDNENETVHMPTKFDVIRITGVMGKQ
jgi:hypothetical protein